MILIRQAKYDKIKHKIYGDGNMIYDIMIVGCGASGLAAAISAKRTNKKKNIAAVEALPRVGKKILATGNGRCNLTNIKAEPSKYSNGAFTRAAFNIFPPREVLAFFRSIGLMTVTDSEGRVYPMSNTASSVLDALRFEAERLGVEFICERHIDSIEKNNGIFFVGNYKAKKVILCTGGCSAPSQGSDGSGFGLLKAFGHKVTDVYPGLVQLTVEENTRPIKGIRVKADVELKCAERTVDRSSGEILFTDYGLSGISIMDVSRNVKDGKYRCNIDVLPICEFSDAVEFLMSMSRVMPAENAMAGLVPRKLGQYILKRAGIRELNRYSAEKIIKTAKNLGFTVNGTMGFKNAQITVGGADVDEFNAKTMESKHVGGLYAAGEILNVDSVCGGFNLQWAWASGLLAGKSAAED